MLSVKTKEHLRRGLVAGAPRWGTLAGGMAALCLTAVCTGNMLRVVTVTDTGGQTGTAITAARRTAALLEQTGVTPAAADDAFEISAKSGKNTITVLRASTVSLTVDGTTNPMVTTGSTVEQALAQAGVTLGEEDEVTPALGDPVSDGTAITVYRVRYEDYTVQEPVPMQTNQRQTSLLHRNPDKTLTLQQGADGEALITYRDRYVDGVWQSKVELSRETLSAMIPEVEETYTESAPVSAFTGPEIVDGVPAQGVQTTYTAKRATAYSASATAKGAAGYGLCYGTVAVNPAVIPYGTLMYIASPDGKFVYGYAYAADTGSAMVAGHAFIDLFYDTKQQAIENAVVSVNVYLIDADTAAQYADTNAELLKQAEAETAALQGKAG